MKENLFEKREEKYQSGDLEKVFNYTLNVGSSVKNFHSYTNSEGYIL